MASACENCKEARALWLAASTKEELEKVEHMYREALNSKQRADKKRKREYAELNSEEYRQAGERLSLLYCQSGRSKKAKKGLGYLGFTCRLAANVLDYPIEEPHNKNKKQKKGKASSAPCVVYDNFLQTYEFQHLKSVFENPSASYWKDHNYQVEPPSKYFSYVIKLKEFDKFGFVGHLARTIWMSPQLRQKFPDLTSAKYVEMWAHNRPHASGHQLHFDSDDEGTGGVRNPIITTILFVTADGGGPSLVTNQRLSSQGLATKGWLAHPKPQRLVAFDGRVLHGVVPGKGVSDNGGRRVTVMLAFWKHIHIQDEPTPGSARPFPTASKLQWARDLTKMPADSVKKKTADFVEQSPIALDCVYETLDGLPWMSNLGMPDYEDVFQGF